MEIIENNTAAPMALQELCFDVLLEKYAAPGETTALEIQQRVASALASNDAQGERFLTGLAAGFVPGGRINSAAGTSRKSTLINCFVQPVADTMTGCIEGVPGIMTALANAVTTMRLGGGVGYDFTPLRPMGAKVKGTESRASGPVSFMRMFDRACETVESAGARRGAQMGVLRVDHPDIEVFIDAKKTPDFETMGLDSKQSAVLKSMMQDKPGFGWGVRQAFATLSNFNISVAVTEEFMKAVIDDAMFDLIHEARPDFEAATKQCPDGKVRYVYRTVRAREVWMRIMRNTFEGAEPGVLFIDRINEQNNLRYCETIAATNPCGEQVLPPYGACDLGSANLTQFVKNPFTPQASFDYQAFAANVAIGVEILDCVLDRTNWPLPQQASESMNKRRIGLGYFGAGDALAMLGIRYDSEAGADLLASITEVMRDAAYMASVELAKELGAFPFFDAEKYLEEGTFASGLPEHIKAAIRKHGIRNSHLLSLAPTGTIAMAFGNNASSGIEPIFSLRQKRTKIMADQSRQTFDLENFSYRLFKQIKGEGAETDVFATALEMSVADHLRVLGKVAPFIDSAISKTVNVPADYSFDDFQQVYLDAWRLGLKGITTYRPSGMLGSVIESADGAGVKSGTNAVQDLRGDDPDRRVELKDVPNITEVLRWPNRPDVTAEGVTYNVKHPAGRFAIVVNHVQNGRKHPLEVYVAGHEQPRALAAIAKALSVDMRTDDGAWLQMKLDSLLSTKGDDGYETVDLETGKTVMMPSLAAGFASVVKHRLMQIGALEVGESSPMMNALFSRREPKTGPMGALGWHVDIANAATGDDFLLHTKELVLPGGQIRPYSVWLSGQYPKVLDGLMKTLSIDMRISDPAWVAMKLSKLTSFGELRGDFLAQVPGESKQQSYPSTVAYVAVVLLARMKALGLINGETTLKKAVPVAVEVEPPVFKAAGRQCPSCMSMSLHKRDGCDICENCGHTGSCG